MAERPRLIGPLPLAARRVSWDPDDRFAITLTDDRRLVGISDDENVWETTPLPRGRWSGALTHHSSAS